jgi:CRP-like cAMP-binding protein
MNKAHPFLEGFTPSQLDALAACARTVRHEAGSYIFHMGEPAEALLLVERGRAVLEVNEPGRGAIRMETVGAGDVLGLSWLFPPFRWHLDARALDTFEATALDADVLKRLIDEDPALGRTVAMRLLGKVYERLERTRLQRLDVYRGHA